jgi:hypothetical protein
MQGGLDRRIDPTRALLGRGRRARTTAAGTPDYRRRPGLG